MKNMTQFKFVDLKKEGTPWYFKFLGWFVLWLVLLFLLSAFFNLFRTVSTVGTLEFILASALVGYLVYKFAFKSKEDGNERIEDDLKYFIESNDLYKTETLDDGKGNKVKKVIDYVTIGYLVNKDRLIIRYMIDGSKFGDKAEDFEKTLSGLFGMNLVNKRVKTSWVDYEFAILDDERIYVNSESPAFIESHQNELGTIHLNSQIYWEYKKMPHALIAGATGGGKTFFINYLIMEFLKDKANLFICDPKKSDLYAMKRVMPKGRVGSTSGQIAGIMRRANEVMEERYERFIEGEDFKFGYDYLDYGLDPVVVFFDEIGAFKAIASKDEAEEVYSYMTSIILKGRQMGVFMVLSTQQPNSDNIPTQIRDQVGARVSLGNMSNEGYRMIFGDNYNLKSVEGKGQGYLLIDGKGWETPRSFESPYISTDDIDVMGEIKRLQSKIDEKEERKVAN